MGRLPRAETQPPIHRGPSEPSRIRLQTGAASSPRVRRPSGGGPERALTQTWPPSRHLSHR
eukprot:1596263-Alexandrium_andersonii.AAC.1